MYGYCIFRAARAPLSEALPDQGADIDDAARVVASKLQCYRKTGISAKPSLAPPFAYRAVSPGPLRPAQMTCLCSQSSCSCSARGWVRRLFPWQQWPVRPHCHCVLPLMFPYSVDIFPASFTFQIRVDLQKALTYFILFKGFLYVHDSGLAYLISRGMLFEALCLSRE